MAFLSLLRRNTAPLKKMKDRILQECRVKMKVKAHELGMSTGTVYRIIHTVCSWDAKDQFSMGATNVGP